jgi:hypothetical protein
MPSASDCGSSGSTSTPPPVASTTSVNAPRPWLHDRHATRHGLQEKQTFRLVVSGRNGEHVEAAQEHEFAGTVDFASVLELVSQAGAFELLPHVRQVAGMCTGEIARCRQLHRDVRRSLSQPNVGVRQHVQPLFGRDACEVADRKRPVAGWHGAISVHSDA